MHTRCPRGLWALGLVLALAFAGVANAQTTWLQISQAPPATFHQGKPHTIQTSVGGLCLDIKDQKTDNGAVLQLYPCSGAANQAFFLQPSGLGYVKILGQQSGRALDVVNAGTENGAPVQLWDFAGGDHQQWGIKPQGGGFAIVNKKSLRCLDVAGARFQGGTKLQIWDCNGQPQQTFQIQPK